VRLKDVARIELGAQNYSAVGRLNGKPGDDHRGLPVPGSMRYRPPLASRI